MWEALELGAQAEEPQLPPTGGGAPIPIRAAVDAVSPRRQFPQCEQEAAALGVTGTPAPTAADRNGGLGPFVDALYALTYFGSGDPDNAQAVVVDGFASLCDDPRATSPHQRWGCWPTTSTGRTNLQTSAPFRGWHRSGTSMGSTLLRPKPLWN